MQSVMAFRRDGKANGRMTEKHVPELNRDGLLDGFFTLFEECNHENLKKISNVSSFVTKYERAVAELKEQRMKASDFEVKAVIGRGHFGEVRVVREKATGAVYAMKVLRKSDLLAQPEIAFFEEERDIMAKSSSPWITQLHFAFQDPTNLYLVMDFHVGGDLLSLLARHDDIFEEDMAKFYIAEMAIAINNLHEMGYLHRDIKPENVLLDCNGHVKLADFGSAAKLTRNKTLSAKMPVGTPDYVAPELLTSIDKYHLTYGAEVDWWSLGVCAFEMLFGSTPFTDENSTAATYANIMNYKNSLRLPSDSDVSQEAKDFLKQLLTDSESRMKWEDIKAHPFLSGIKWDSIRESVAAYVPSIHGLDDTSYFDEVERVHQQPPDVEILKSQKNFSGRDLPFVGFTFVKGMTNKTISFEESAARTPAVSNSLETDCNNSNILNTAQLSDDMFREGSSLMEVIAQKDMEIKTLQGMLNSWESTENRSVSLLEYISSTNKEIKDIEEELLDVKVEEMKGEIIALETEQENLRSKLHLKETQVSKLQSALEEAQQQVQSQRRKLEKEKRKSREDQRNDLVLLELRNDTWHSLVEEKQSTIDELTAKLKHYEDLVEAFENSEEQQASEITQLQRKMNTSLYESIDPGSSLAVTDVRMFGGVGEAKVELDNIHHAKCPSKKKLTLHVTLKAGRCSFVDNEALEKLQDLQKMVDKYAEKAREWRSTEEEQQSKIATLESDIDSLRQREGMSRKMKENLMEKVTTYQKEVTTQKGIIRDLQGTMKNYLDKSSSLSDAESRLKEAEKSKLYLEAELYALKEEVDKSRQAALNKTAEMEEAIKKLEEQRALAQDYKQRYDCQAEMTEAKIRSFEEELTKVTFDRQRLERREATLTTQVESLQGLLDERTVEMEKLERRNTDIQTHLQQLQHRNSALQVQVESLQRSTTEKDELRESKAELNYQVTRLQQQNGELERRITSAIREKQGLEDKISLSDREKDRLMRRIDRLEAGEKEKHQLEVKVEKIAVLERENRRLEGKIDRLSHLEKEKLNLEEKEEKLQMELRREKIQLETITAEKRELEAKMRKLESKRNAESSEEATQLKMKITLLETVEKEKSNAEKELGKLRLEKEKLEKERDGFQREKEVLKKDKTAAEKMLESVKKEKVDSDKQVLQLNKQVDGLETSMKTVQESKLSSEAEVKRLSSEINRLQAVVDRIDSEKSGKELKRNSSGSKSNLIERLQREKSELQKQVEILESQKQKSKRSSLAFLQEGGIRKLREDSEEKVKKLEAELSEVRSQLKKYEKEANDKSARNQDAAALRKKNKDQEEEVSALKEEVKEKEQELNQKKKEIDELKSRLEVETANVSELRAQVKEQVVVEEELVSQLEKMALAAEDASKEKIRLEAQLKDKSEHSQSFRSSGELKFEKIQQDTKLRELTEERDELKRKVALLSKDGEQEDKTSEVTKLQSQLAEARREIEIRLGASQAFGNNIPAYLRHELDQSNLALSEARSLLSASKRQELELRDRIDRLQRLIDNKAVENAKYLQNSQDAIAELKTLMSQHDTLHRQYQVLEGKYASVQKEQGSNSYETVRLMEEMQSKQQQCQMESKKVETLTKECAALEELVKEMEGKLAEAEKREAEWNSIKQTYEKAMYEREDELDGVNQQMSEAKSEASDKISSMRQQLESSKALHKAELENISHSLREERAKVHKLNLKISELEEKERASVTVLETQTREADKFSQERMKLKEELTELLSDNCSLRKENLQLKKHLEEAMDKFEMIIGEKVSLENFNEALQGLHFLDKYKFESTIGQQMKLIDYLQDVYLQHCGKKKKKNSKFFGKASKDGSGFAPVPLTDLQALIEEERHKNTLLQEKLDKLREENYHQASELLKIQSSSSKKSDSSGRIQANLSVKLTPSALNALTHSPASQCAEFAAVSGSTTSLASNASVASSASSSSSKSGSSSTRTPRNPGSRHRRGGEWMEARGSHPPEPMPTPQRMRHNIPHRFATGLNTRASKCGLCLGSVHFVKQASKCQECGLVVHPKCASSVPATCGLPTEYVRHFALMMNRIYQDEVGRDSEVDQSAVKMEGWLKVPRLGKSGWENRYCVLEGTWLTLFLEENDASPVDSFDLNPPDADVSVHSAVTSAELNNTASSDLHYVLRLDQDPLTTCWPGRYLYLMTTNFVEKQRWVASFEAIVKSAQCKNDLYRNRSQMLTIMSLKDHERRDFNCTLVISQQLVLVGTEDGLYAFNPQALTSKRKQMTQLSGFGSVHQMALAKGVELILLLTGPERRLVMLENKLVKCRMSQTLGGETTPFSFKTVEGLQGCTVFDVGLWNNASYLCVGTPTKLYLMKYNHSLAMYCVRKEFPTTEPCSCVCIADSLAIVGTERFYKMSLEHPSMLDFVDRQDNSLAFAAYGAANHQSFPLAVVRVSPENLPLEFLLCFHEFGVFVDHHGQRSRATDVKWSGLPLAFSFEDPFLYVTYTNTIQATVIPTDRSQAKGRQTVIDVQSPRFLGPAPLPGCVYISSSNSNTNITEIIRIRGQEDFCSDTETDKENFGSTKSALERQVQFSSPTVLKTPQGRRLRRQGSLTSLNSNSSAGTFASIESDV